MPLPKHMYRWKQKNVSAAVYKLRLAQSAAAKLRRKKLAVNPKPKERHQSTNEARMPDVEPVEPRVPSENAGGKVALKQMSPLLENHADGPPQILSDDEVIPVDVTPPRKKRKLDQSTTTFANSDQDVIVLHNVDNQNNETCDLVMECWEEELSPVQLAHRNTLKAQEQEFQEKMTLLINSPLADVIYQGELTSLIQVSNSVEETPADTPAQPNVINSVILSNPATSNPAQCYQLIMDPRLGLIAFANTPTTSAAASTVEVPQAQPQQNIFQGAAPQRSVPPVVTEINSKSNPPPKTGIQKPPALVRDRPTVTTHSSERNEDLGVDTTGSTVTKKVISTPNNPPSTAAFMSDATEIVFNKYQGKTFPSLVIVAKPQLRVNVSDDRFELDRKVKSVLLLSFKKFTEWFLENGLLKPARTCAIHTSRKLGIDSVVPKLFNSKGRFVWVTKCCPKRFASIFNGSIFEDEPRPLLVFLKLLYHWVCQTDIKSVTQLLKVENLFVKGFYALLRAVCTVALHTHCRYLGGAGIKVQIGIISLGTSSLDNQRKVKVEVLGVMETISRHLRLYAIEPSDVFYKKRFETILAPLKKCVHPSSTIVIDLAIDKAALQSMGFTNIIQGPNAINSNDVIMNYLRRVVPKMFQTTLSLLSLPLIQQFLDELVWREWFGTSPLRAFDNLVEHLGEQTRYGEENLIIRLNKVSAYPFKDWTITIPKPVTAQLRTTPTNTKQAQVQETKIQKYVMPPKKNSPDVPEQLVPLKNYYYGTMRGNTTCTPVRVQLYIKCPICKMVIDNNIQLMTHLFRHVSQNSLNTNENRVFCRYCLASGTNQQQLFRDHIKPTHPIDTKHLHGFVCLICEEYFNDQTLLGKHMSKEHCPSELPYQCPICCYRCSNHKQIIDHFYDQHANGPMIQCPFCLKTTPVYSTKENVSKNVYEFLQHLRTHQQKNYERKCDKCNLRFVQSMALMEHMTKMHTSQRGKPWLVSSWLNDGVMVPISAKVDPSPKGANNLNALTYNVPKYFLCKECKMPMDLLEHFQSFENHDCHYSTYCTYAMHRHMANCKNPKHTPTALHKLPFKLYCLCGYSTTDGNSMAPHLVRCEEKSAFLSSEIAQMAADTRRISLRKPEVAAAMESDVDSSNEPISMEEMFKSSKICAGEHSMLLSVIKVEGEIEEQAG